VEVVVWWSGGGGGGGGGGVTFLVCASSFVAHADDHKFASRFKSFALKPTSLSRERERLIKH
jgi:hypothetical protein